VNIDIIRNTKIWLGVSGVLILISLFGIIFKGLNYGIDFTGGNLFQLKFQEEVSLQKLNPVLDGIASKIPQLDSRSRKVQISEDNVAIIRTLEMSEEQKTQFLSGVEAYSNYELQKSEKVGATIGSELKRTAIYALIIGGILIVMYITLRFEFKFAIAAIIALFHDIIISVGFIAILGYELNTPFIAALLTILGYSINDTIVVFDRIRENLRRKKAVSLAESINISINQVMTRSINTSLTTFLAIIAILVFGGDSLKTFITTLLIGVVVGTYSSIFVASPVVNILEKKQSVTEV
jgi:preprotein translocase subunit SecF